MTLPESIGVYGLGRWGTTLALALHERALPLRAVASYRPRASEQLPPPLRSLWCETLEAFLDRARWVFLTVRDDAIEPTVRTWVQQRPDWRGWTVIHASGLHGPDRLEPLKVAGAHVGVFHPLNTFPDPTSGLQRLPGTPFAVVAEGAVRDGLVEIARRLGGYPCEVPPALQPVYHLVAVLVANAPLVVIAAGHRLLHHSGLASFVSWDRYGPLMEAALENARSPDPFQRLTGPWIRHDRSTIDRHRAVLRNLAPELLPLYEVLAEAVTVLETK